MTILGKVATIAKNDGVAVLLSRALFSLYRRSLRRMLPAVGFVRYAGIAVGRARKVGDRALFRHILPPDLRDNPTYEQGLVAALNATVKASDRVVVVGGGEGVTTVLAATLAGQGGSVICFEGDEDGIGAVHRTAEANGVLDRIECRHAVVASNLGVFGTSVSEILIEPKDLPDCDVLEMDCEGSEVQILREMTITPRVVAVETHGFNGASTAIVREILEGRGYRVEDLGLAEPKQACVGRDEHVLLAQYA